MPERRTRAALAGITAALGCGLLAACGSAPPTELRWAVLGDALVVRFRDPGRDDVRLRVGDEVLTPEARAPDGTRRAVYRPLPVGEGVAAHLVWSGGESPVFRARAGEPAVASFEVPEDGGADLMIRAARPCEAWWVGDTKLRFQLERGETRVPVPWPLPAALELAWREDSLEFRAPADRRQILGKVAQRLLRAAEVPDCKRALDRRRDRGNTLAGEDFAADRVPWRAHLGWLPEVLEADLEPGLRSAVWERLVGWQACVAGERFLGDQPEGLDLPAGRAGAAMAGKKLPYPTRDFPVALEPLDGDAPWKSDGALRILPARLKHYAAFGQKSFDYSSKARFPWPETPPSPTGVACVSLDFYGLRSDLLVRVWLRGGAEDGDLVIPHPAVQPPKDEDVRVYQGWTTSCFPAAMIPPAGSPVMVTVEDLVADAFSFVEVNQVVVRVPEPAP